MSDRYTIALTCANCNSRDEYQIPMECIFTASVNHTRSEISGYFEKDVQVEALRTMKPIEITPLECTNCGIADLVRGWEIL